MNEGVEHAEALLARRELRAALLAFDRAEGAGADPDRCCAGRWMVMMLAGEFKAAWRQSDAIRARGGVDPHRFFEGRDAGDLRGKRVMVRSLHGFGDAVMMLRYATRLKALAASVTYEVAPDLVELARCFAGVDEVITWGEDAPGVQPDWDVQVEVMELPYVFRTGVDDLPLAQRYIRVPGVNAQRAGQAMGERRLPRVGVCSSASDWDPKRNPPPELMDRLLAVPGVEFWCMDRTGGLNGDPRLRSVRGECGDGLLALAAAIDELDLVITVDTLAAHLAGALGKPVWLMLQFAADWRWMVGLGHTPWYPTIDLHRQQTAGQWQGVVDEVVQCLRWWVEGFAHG